MRAQHGFTLIELMIVIAIIGILAAIAIPQYQDYVIRSKISEGLSLVQPMETSVADNFETYGYIPTTGNVTGANSFGLPKATSIAGSYVQSVEVTGTSGVITITYNPAIGGGIAAGSNVLTLTPGTGHGMVIWACGKTKFTAGGITADGSGGTTSVPNKYLPVNCRG
ncbi:MAG TPA: pilin [Gammaproteobacteria bacterium]|nr:pilin [Gammaproteobacteria bacterium]